MIYLNLKGGLGNMMFQIAAAKSISLSKKTDYSFPNLHSHINYLTLENIYNPKVNYCLEYLSLPFLKNANTSQSFLSVKTVTYPFHFEDIIIPTSNVRIDGFFQSEKYFKNHEKEILELFLPDEKILEGIGKKYSELLNKKTTSIHIRRGDYIKNSTHHFVQDMDYFNQAMSIVDSETDKYLIFSDDIEWCKEKFRGDKFTFIENEKDYNELYLMSMCNNNIISNSSFSWWGAWLNQNHSKTIIGPKNWFGPSLQNLKTDDIIPNKWIKL
jgi:hypothetical protein